MMMAQVLVVCLYLLCLGALLVGLHQFGLSISLALMWLGRRACRRFRSILDSLGE